VLFGQSTRKVLFDYNSRLDADRMRLYQEQQLSNVCPSICSGNRHDRHGRGSAPAQDRWQPEQRR
jgi:hypothetical protein